MKNNKGFTLIELLVVIAIIGILASIVLVNVNNARNKAKIARAQAELRGLRMAIEMLYDDTGLHPNHLQTSPCVQNPEVYLDSCDAGIQCTDGDFPNWGGPYMTVPKDPWGTYYYFDPDYRCRTFVRGCETVADNVWVRAIVSFGPNKSEDYDDGDNIVLILCRP